MAVFSGVFPVPADAPACPPSEATPVASRPHATGRNESD
jgi:hypothetical protein